MRDARGWPFWALNSTTACPPYSFLQDLYVYSDFLHSNWWSLCRGRVMQHLGGILNVVQGYIPDLLFLKRSIPLDQELWSHLYLQVWKMLFTYAPHLPCSQNARINGLYELKDVDLGNSLGDARPNFPDNQQILTDIKRGMLALLLSYHWSIHRWSYCVELEAIAHLGYRTHPAP